MNRPPTLHVYRPVENVSPAVLDFIKDQQSRKVEDMVDSGRMRYLDESMDPSFIRPQDEGKLVATLVRPGTFDEFVRSIKRHSIQTEDILDLKKFLSLTVLAGLQQTRTAITRPPRIAPDIRKHSWVLMFGSGRQLVRPPEVEDVEAAIKSYFDVPEEQSVLWEQRLHIGQTVFAAMNHPSAENLLSGVGGTMASLVKAGSVPAQLELGEIVAWPVIPKSA